MASSTVILKIICRNMGNIVESYVHDDELLERKLDSNETFKNCAKSSKKLQWIDELTV